MVKGRERSQKWYFQNEKEVMRELGFKPASGSGAGWLEKEDGENDHLIAQLKSTDKQSYKLNLLDLQKLEHHALVSGKVPVFIIQFLGNDTRYALTEIENLPAVAEYIETGTVNQTPIEPLILDDKPKKRKKKPTIKSSADAREEFNRQKQEAWEGRKFR